LYAYVCRLCGQINQIANSLLIDLLMDSLKVAYHLTVELVLGVKTKHARTILYNCRSELFTRHNEPST